jgi:hypothetical protein
VPQLGDLVLELQFSSLEFDDPERIGGWMGHRVLDFPLESLVPTFKLRHISLQRHVGPSYQLFRLAHFATGIPASRRQSMLRRQSFHVSLILPCPIRSSILGVDNGHACRRRDGLLMGSGLSQDEAAEFEQELARLKQEHRDLDTAIEALERMVAGDQLQIQRLKKRKLILKDRIGFLEDQLTPDIIA